MYTHLIIYIVQLEYRSDIEIERHQKDIKTPKKGEIVIYTNQ